MTLATSFGSVRGHVWWPLAVFVVLAILFESTRIDVWLADLVYRWEGNTWALRRDAFVRGVLHKDANAWITAFYVMLVVVCAMSFFVGRLQRFRWGLVYLVTAVALSTLSVALLKDITRVQCPWSIDRYGGVVAYATTWRQILMHGTSGRCFPSGHAGSGYALLAFYFFCRRYAPAWRWWAFAVAMSIGTIFGVAQQLRGAHYLSHDVWSLAICWFSAIAVTPILKRATRAG